jgi:hypothetical protein
VVVVVSAVLPAFIRARNTPSMNSCVNNLRQLEGAKQAWQLQNHRATNEVTMLEDLLPYLPRSPVCPQGGTYTLGRVGESPTCSLGGTHALPQ